MAGVTPSGMSIIASGRGALQALVLIFVANLVPPVHAADEAKSESELKTLRARIADLDRELAADRREQDSLGRDIQTAEQALARAARTARETEAAVAKQRQQVETARNARATALAQAQARRADLGRALRALYTAGSPGRLQLLFRLDEIAALDRLEVDASAIARALQRRLADLQATAEQLRIAEEQLGLEQVALEQRSAASREAVAALKSAQLQRRGKLDELARRGSDRAAELARAKSEQARVEKLLEQLRRALKDSPMKFEKGVPFKSQRGRLPWPLRGPLIARFGAPKNGGPLTWSGWWISSDPGNPVRAVADGRAVYVGWVQRYGLVVILDHPGQYLSLYGHVQDAQVEVGEVVTAGTRIAQAGNSGGHEQSGVYFEIREGSSAVDPKSWLLP